MNARSQWLVLLVALALPGCYPGYGSWGSSSGSSSTSSWSDPTSATSSNLDVQAGHQTGDMGDIRTFDADALRLQGTRDAYSSYVQLDSLGTGWWVMTGFSFDVDIDTLQAGHTYYASSYYGDVSTPPSGTPAAEPVSVEVRGCSGPHDGDYTYDDLATQTTFSVEQLPDGPRRVHYDCTFVSDAGVTQHATGYFDFTTSDGSATSPSASGPAVQVNGI